MSTGAGKTPDPQPPTPDAAAATATATKNAKVVTATARATASTPRLGSDPLPDSLQHLEALLGVVQRSAKAEPLLRHGSSEKEKTERFTFNGVDMVLQVGERAQARRRAFFAEPRLFHLFALARSGASREATEGFAWLSSKTAARLTRQEEGALAAVGVLPPRGAPLDSELLTQLSPEMPEFLRILPRCNSAASLATNRACEPAYFTAWSILYHARQRQERALRVATREAKDDVELGEWQVWASQLSGAMKRAGAAPPATASSRDQRQEVLEALMLSNGVHKR